MCGRRAVLALLGLSLAVPGCAAGSAAGSRAPLRARRVGVKSGVMEFAYSQDPETIETVYFDDFGDKQAKVSTSDVHDGEGSVLITMVTIVSGGALVQYDVHAKRGFQRPVTESEFPVTPTLTEEQIASLSPSQVADMDLHVLDPIRVGSVVANGYATRRRQLVLAQWGYRGVFLKSEVLVLREGRRDVESTSIARTAEFDVKIDPARFLVPNDVLVSAE